MDRLVNAVMDLVVPPASMVMLAFAWPTLSFLRGVEWALKTLTKEDMLGKVVVITGASSAIGEQIAYEYARRNASLVLVARREQRLFGIRDNARQLGAGQVLVIAADVVKEEDCRRLVADTVSYFGQLNHLVNTVSLSHDFSFEEAGDTTAFPHLMDINFWGNVYPTYAALPYLRRSHGRVVVNASVESWLPMPRMSLYSAAKAAVVDFYETLRYEVKDEVGVTVATHGWAGGGKFTLDHQEGAAEVQWKQEEREAAALPGGGHVEAYARALVAGACRGDAYVKRPSWYDVFLVFRVFAPDVLAWTFRLLLSSTPAAAGPTTSAITARRPPPAALPAPPVRPLLEYTPVAASRRPAHQVQKLE
ncbi:11-beta-hydroxysteroid dehydrogenase B-like [Miscanthus floridulus]|uniref:11-beta-hydroxysteroid dehydrogenase B-like n=1 Tax=Miscanthus floridulus TaxID=154761 RepID=UPI003457EDC9